VTEQDDTYDYWAEDPISTDEFGRVYARKIHRPDPTVWTSNDTRRSTRTRSVRSTTASSSRLARVPYPGFSGSRTVLVHWMSGRTS
jgi:hypothetical protein